jgi:hypothetical protein
LEKLYPNTRELKIDPDSDPDADAEISEEDMDLPSLKSYGAAREEEDKE